MPAAFAPFRVYVLLLSWRGIIPIRARPVSRTRPSAVPQPLARPVSLSLTGSIAGAIRPRPAVRAHPAVFFQASGLPGCTLLLVFGRPTIPAATGSAAGSTLSQKHYGACRHQNCRDHRADRHSALHVDPSSVVLSFGPAPIPCRSNINRTSVHELLPLFRITDCSSWTSRRGAYPIRTV